jgi:hypothetical protein
VTAKKGLTGSREALISSPSLSSLADWFTVDQASQINLSIRESQRSNDLATWNSVSKQWLELDALFIKHPEIRPYIFSNRDILEDDQQIVDLVRARHAKRLQRERAAYAGMVTSLSETKTKSALLDELRLP